MDHVKPGETSVRSSGTSRSRSPSTSTSPSPHDSQERAIDVLENSINEDTPLGILLGIHNAAPTSQLSEGLPTPEADHASHSLSKGRFPKHEKICRSLHALFPAQSDIETIVKGTGGAYFVTAIFHNHQDILAGHCETALDLCVIPPVTAHPTVLARRLLQLCICMQQLSPAFNKEDLTMKTNLSQTMNAIVSTIASLVTSNDELVCTSEGLQSLTLQAIWHSNVGNLRKSWLCTRRALSLAQLMGIDRGNLRAFKSMDLTSDPKQHASAASVWYKIVYCDRFVSLLLGLPLGTWDKSFATEEAMLQDSPQEKLSKTHTVIAARIVERNFNKTPQAYTMTQEIDYELEKAGQLVDANWWQVPILNDPFAPHETMAEAVCVFIHQIHHFDLLIVLHLPYMLRDPAESRYEYSRTTCTRASREVLKRFVNFRTIINSAFSCRHVDYSALIAAMTLLLSYLGQHKPDGTGQLPQNNVPTWPLPNTIPPPSPCPPIPANAPMCTVHEDRKLIEAVRERMTHVAIINGDKLSQESADIISQLLPVLAMREKDNETAVLDCLHLSVPYLGTVSIRPGETSAGGAPAAGGNGNTGAPYHISFAGGGAAPGAMPIPMEQQMDFSDLDQMMAGGLDGGGEMSFATGFDPQMLPDAPFPEPTAEADDWALQGVDTTYWSMLNGGV